jgi:hypothetical protein
MIEAVDVWADVGSFGAGGVVDPEEVSGGGSSANALGSPAGPATANPATITVVRMRTSVRDVRDDECVCMSPSPSSSTSRGMPIPRSGSVRHLDGLLQGLGVPRAGEALERPLV